jgi:hypothetical protein
LCHRHWQHWRKYGRPESRTVEERFWAKVDASAGFGGCWIWQGYIKPNGYGQFNAGAATHHDYAHRFALTLKLGRPLGDGMYACHTCDNPICCNPAHLFEGDNRANQLDSHGKGRGRWAKRAAA